jgi:hypothetical protein
MRAEEPKLARLEHVFTEWAMVIAYRRAIRPEPAIYVATFRSDADSVTGHASDLLHWHFEADVGFVRERLVREMPESHWYARRLIAGEIQFAEEDGQSDH